MRALVVDATPGTVAMVQLALDAQGWDVAERRGDTVDAGADDADLVILDLDRDDADALGRVERLRAARPHISILVLSSGPGRSEGIAALLAGADGFITKPFGARELVAQLGAAARRRIRSRAVRSQLQGVITGVTSEVADAVIITTADRRIQSFNAAAEELYGFQAADVIGRLTSEVLRWVGSESAFDVERERLASSGEWHGVADQYRRDGTVVRVRSATQVLEDDVGATIGYISVNRLFTHERTDADDQAFKIGQDEMAAGLAAGEFVVHYQPIFEVDGSRVVGVEALVRWQHGGELLGPDTFIAAAEESDLVVDIGRVVLAEGCAQVERWRQDGHDLHLTVNLAARQLLAPSLVDDLRDVMAATGMGPGKLTLEVTETALIGDVAAAGKVLVQIAGLGVGVSIDDFGTGWASLTYLQQLPVSCLKIDRSFVARLGVDRRDTAIVRSVIALGRELDLIVIAEGIETEEQLEHLRLLGCRYGQGFVVARPTPAADVRFSR